MGFSLADCTSNVLHAGSPLMLNGKLKDHQELWQALVKVEKMFATVPDEVTTAVPEKL